jgi:hypothetical protein
MDIRALLYQLIEKLEGYNLSTDVLWGALDSFRQNVVNIYSKLRGIEGLNGVIILEFGLVEPLCKTEIRDINHHPPLPNDVLKLIDILRSIPVLKLKEVLHEEILVMQSKGGGRKIYRSSIPSDFMDPTYSPSNFRPRIVLNTIIYNKFMSDRALENGIREFRHLHYPKIDVRTLPKNIPINSQDINQDFVDIPRSRKTQIFDFKGYQSCLFVYALACYYVHLVEERWTDEDELLELTQSLITLAELRKQFRNKNEHSIERAKNYLRKRRHIEQMVKKHLGKLVQLGVLRKVEKFGQNLYALSALSFSDKRGQTIWLPSTALLKRVQAENFRNWNSSPSFDIDNVPGRPQDRVFIGGPTSYLPTLRVIESICISNGKQPILTYDFNISAEKIYKSCIRLLLDCSYAIFEVSESAGQLFEIQKALEFGTPTLLLYRKDKQVSQMLLTLSRVHHSHLETYSNFEEMQERINKFFQIYQLDKEQRSLKN